MAWAPDYTTAADLAVFMRIGDSDDNAVLARAVTAASRAVDKATGRQFGLVAAPEARVYRALWDTHVGRWSARIDDLMTTTGLEVATDPEADFTWTGEVGSAYLLREPNAVAKGIPWSALDIARTSEVFPSAPDRVIQVTARWGWTSVPVTVVEATLLQASRFAARRDSPYGITGGGDQTPAIRLMDKTDPDVTVMLRPYRRTWAVM